MMFLLLSVNFVKEESFHIPCNQLEINLFRQFLIFTVKQIYRVSHHM